MRFAEYVITGWALTAAVIGGYWIWIVQRTRRAEQSLPADSSSAEERE